MYVVKRNGHHEEVHFDKITSRIARLAYGLDVDPTRVAQKVIQGFYKGITTAELDMLAVEVCEHLQTVLPDYDKLGARLLVRGRLVKTCAVRSFARKLVSPPLVHARAISPPTL